MLVFQTRPVLLDYGIAEKFISKQLREYTKIKNGEIKDTEEAIGVLSEVINGIQEKLTNRILQENTYDSLLKLLWIFDEIHSSIEQIKFLLYIFEMMYGKIVLSKKG